MENVKASGRPGEIRLAITVGGSFTYADGSQTLSDIRRITPWRVNRHTGLEGSSGELCLVCPEQGAVLSRMSISKIKKEKMR